MKRRQPIRVSDAINRVMHYAQPNEIETVQIEACDDRTLAEDIVATHAIPPFPKSPYDGYAFKAMDTKGASQNKHVTFEVIEHIPAGKVGTKQVQTGQAVRIMTGAPIPKGTDCVAMFEICQSDQQYGKEWMTIKREMAPGDNVMAQGSETKEGTKLLHKGTYINPGVKAILATFGYQEVPVAKRPVVGLITTGTELLQVGDELKPGKIRNSNGPMIASQLKRAGAKVVELGSLTDEFTTSYQAVEKGLQRVDMLITTGGVSVGDYDLMPAIYEKLGAKTLFNKVAMRPGSVTTVAVRGKQLLFGLSGNPSACYVGFELFVRPTIRAALYEETPHPQKIKAYLKTDFPKANPFTRFVRSTISYAHGNVYIEPSGIDKSAVVTSLAKANAFMVLPGGTRGFQKGQLVDALLFQTEQGQRDIWQDVSYE
ncbi:molybdopterin molybdotransferase MoeA [Pontibacillus litoralis]|uniref:Molybdopterin molybdenumtransferase n=1 Tax=Pontibacillus litoralis JSM 072002 TaxID=1385512 RepID=A0A0A5HTG1_9BACI|nr:gephyrin-like molybdotransferase Glp [Pontibacillus litoralis]KGX86912.1 molybdopterin molybdenumtransferase [Pontibacillus litoralis JSM 072002]